MHNDCMVASTIDVNRLRVFRAVVASGTVQAAASRLGYSPSAVSQHIGALQRETGLTLFEKSGRGIAPTAAGRLLAAGSEDVMDSLARLGGLVDDLRDGRTGTLSIGTFASAGEMWVPSVAKAIGEEFPDVLLTLDLNEYPADGAGSFDIELRTEDPDEPPVELPGHRRHVLLEEPYDVLVPAGHRLAGEDAVPLAALAGERWVDDDLENTTCGRILRNAWRSAGMTRRIVARASDHHAAIAFVAAGVGLTMAPILAIGTLPHTVCRVPVVDPTPTRRIVALVRESASAALAVERAMELLREAADRTT